MKAIIHTLGQVLYSPSQYVIPVFQRNYRWELPQWQRLWASLDEIQQPGKTGNHFMGFLVYVLGGTPQPGQNTRFHVIDGQQRLTTLSLLLVAIRNMAERSGMQELAQEIHEYYLVHPLKKGENHYRLLPKELDQTAYLAILHRNETVPGRMVQAVDYFHGLLVARAATEPGYLRRIFEVISQRLDFMGATLESESAYSIFKSLNSTGVPLSQADLIRNFVFMHVAPEEQDEFDGKLWRPLEAGFSGSDGRLNEDHFARFFRDLLMAQGLYVAPKLTFPTFEARYEATGFDPMTLTLELSAKARQYAVITSRASDASPAVTRALSRLNQLDSSTTYPLLLWLFGLRAASQLTSEELARAIEMLSGFILRRFVVGESSRGYGETFVRAIRPDVEKPLEILEHYLLERGWPHDARFVESFVQFPLYKRGYAREVLEALEVASGHKEPASLTQAQIEHVMPQSLSDEWAEVLGDEAEQLHAEWLHRPGNLTLSAYNQEVGNQPFAAKKVRFAQSNIGLTRELAEYARWTEAEIRERGEHMAMEAAALWIGPQQAFESGAESYQERRAKDARMAFWSALADYVGAHYPNLPPIEPVPRRVLPLQSGLPRVRLRLRYRVQDGAVTLAIGFEGKIRELWNQLEDSPEQVDAWIGEPWTFELAETSDRAWMLVQCAPGDDGPHHWPMLHEWLASKLARVHAHVLPWLRETSGAAPDNDERDGEPRALTRTRQRQLDFWLQLIERIRAESDSIRPQKPRPQHWLNISIGRSGFGLVPTLNQQVARLGVEIAVSGKEPKRHFKALLAQRAAIEQELGFTLDWQELPNAHQCRIACWRSDSPLDDASRWPEYVQWMAARAIRMDAAFRSRIKALD